MNLLSGLQAGLLNSFYCAGVCLPVVFSFSILKSEENRRQFYFGIFNFLFGRLLGYLLIAVVVGYTGQLLSSRVGYWPKVTAMVQIVVAILIILSVFNRNVFGRAKLSLPFNYNTSLFVFGLALGINICPPFILAINAGLSLGRVLPVIIYFLGFYFGSSVWMAILLFSPALAKSKRLYPALNIFLILMGMYYFLTGLVRLFE